MYFPDDLQVMGFTRRNKSREKTHKRDLFVDKKLSSRHVYSNECSTESFHRNLVCVYFSLHNKFITEIPVKKDPNECCCVSCLLYF